MENEQHVNANQECFYHKFRPGHEVYRVAWVPEEKRFSVVGPLEITGAVFVIECDGRQCRHYSLAGGWRAPEGDLYFDEQAAIAEAYLRDEKEKRHHVEG